MRIPRELRLPLMEEGPNPEEGQSVARYTLSSVVVHEGESENHKKSLFSAII